MRKNSILISGALLLGAICAVGTYGLISNSFSAFAEETKEVTPEYTYEGTISQAVPAQNAELTINDKLQNLYYTFSGAGDRGVSLIKKEGLEVVIKKDGNIIYEIPSTGNLMAIDNKFTSRLNITLPEAITEAGSYTVEIPEGLILIAESSKEGDPILDENGNQVTDDDGTKLTETIPVYQCNAAATYNFTVKFALPYTLAPQPGTYMLGSLNTFTFTYPEGTSIKVNSGSKAATYIRYSEAGILKDAEGNLVRELTLSNLTATANGNVVTLTVDNPGALTAFTPSDVLYDCLVVPGGLWTASKDGVDDSNVPMEFSKYGLVAFQASSINVSPALNTEQPMSALDLETIRLSFPSEVQWDSSVNFNPNDESSNKTKTVGYLKVAVGTTTKTIANLYPAAQSASGKVLTVKTWAATATSNDLTKVPSCKVYMEIMQNKIYSVEGKAKNSALTFSNFNVQGIDYLALNSTSPADNAIITSNTSTITLNFWSNAKIANPNGKIALYKNGELVQEWKASETSTSTLNTAANGSTSAGFRLTKAIATTDYGTYKINVEKGTFKWVGDENITNDAFESTFYSIEPQKISIEPQDYIENKDASYSEISKFTVTFPQATEISALSIPAYLSYGNVTLTSIKNDTRTYSPISTSNATILGYSIKGNAITFDINPLVSAVKPGYQVVGVILPASLVNVTINGVTSPNTKQTLYFPINRPVQGGVDVAVDGKIDVQNFSDLATIVYTAKQAVYSGSTNGLKAYLLDGEGEIIANYTGKIADGNREITYTSTDLPEDVNPAARIANNYKFEIPAGSLAFGSSSSSSTLRFELAEPYNWDVTVANVNTLVEEIFADATSFDIYAINGAVIARNADKSALLNLTPGLYVINGKTVLIQK
ncbi:MAG: hypothetical protein K2N03_06140 [Muribaculaceae bacterium]|nr:hypothetical protein [Muribaculaceae bacterium]